MFRTASSLIVLPLGIAFLAAGFTSVTAQNNLPVPPPGLTQYQFGAPSDDETAILQYINRARANPTAEGERLAVEEAFIYQRDWEYPGSPGMPANVQAELAQAQLQLRSDFSSYSPRPPLAFNAQLNAAAAQHVADMISTGIQQHNSSDGTDPGTRVTSFGYLDYAGENVEGTPGDPRLIDPLSLHDLYQVDPGNPGYGHRLSIMEAGGLGNVEIGIATRSLGGWSTEDFGAGITVPLVSGAAYVDNAARGFYAVGEGLDGVVVTAPGCSSYYAVTAASGAYSLPLDLVPIYRAAYYYDQSTGKFVSPQPTATPPVVNLVFTDSSGSTNTRTVTLTHTSFQPPNSDPSDFTLTREYHDAGGNVRYDNAAVDLALPGTTAPTPTPSPTPTPTPMPISGVTVNISSNGTSLFVISRAGSDSSQPMTVAYKSVGSAQSGTDYIPLNGTKKIKAGASSATIKVKPLPGATGVVKLKLLSQSGYTVGTASQAKIRLGQ